MVIVRYTLEEVRALRGTTDWDRLDAMTDEEILKAAAEDPDSFVPTPEQLKEFKRVSPPDLAEPEAAFGAAKAPADERTVVLMLLHLVLRELTDETIDPRIRHALAEVIYNAPLRLADQERVANTLSVIRKRAEKLGAAARIENLIKVAADLAAGI